MSLVQVKLYILLFVSITYAYNIKLCCPLGYRFKFDECLLSSLPDNLKIYNSTTKLKEIDGKVLNVINYAWCRHDDEYRETEEITSEYYLQEDGQLYIPHLQEEYFQSSRFCLGMLESEDEPPRMQFIPILCTFDVIEEHSTIIAASTTKTITSMTTTIATSNVVTPPINCECNSEPKFSEKFCRKWLDGLFESCVKCTIENTCNGEECGVDISLIEFVDAFKGTGTGNKYLVQVNKQSCPYWQYTYNLNKNDTIYISILKESCKEPKQASFKAGTLLYVGLVSLIIFLILLGIIIYLIMQKRKDAVYYAALNMQCDAANTTELNPMFRPETAMYTFPEEVNFKSFSSPATISAQGS